MVDSISSPSSSTIHGQPASTDPRERGQCDSSGRSLVIRRPDDWHLHLRDGRMLSAVLPATARTYSRALVMPNLDPPVVNGAEANAYRKRILSVLPRESRFSPLMTLYLTEETDPADVRNAITEGIVAAVKLYPANATTNSRKGVRDFDAIHGVLAELAELGAPLCVHGEVVDAETDIFDREAAFIERVLEPIRRRHPALKVVLEHITTKDAVDYVLQSGRNTAATITAHHLLINRNHLLAGGLRPHYYCLPVAKRERHRIELVKAATSGTGSFFLGTDSAPHLDRDKKSSCGCAGIFSAPVALPCVAQAFDSAGKLENLESFVSLNGANFYGIPPSEDQIRLEWRPEPMKAMPPLRVGGGMVTVFNPGTNLHWRACGRNEGG